MMIRTHLKLAVAAPLLLGLVAGAALVMSQRSMHRDRQRGRAVEQVARSMNDLHSLIGVYSLFHEERARLQFLAEHDIARRSLAAVRVTSPDEQHLLDTLGDNTETMREEFLRLVAMRAHRPAELDSADSSPDAKRLEGRLLVRSRQAVADTLRLDTLVKEDIAANRRRTMILVFALIWLVALPLTLVLARIMHRIGRNFATLHRGAEVVGGGNLAHRVGLAGRDELAGLAQAFDRMTARLQAVTVSRDDLDREARERTLIQEALRRSEEQLQRANAELARRIAELEAANADVRASRQAALNLTKDAVEARREAECAATALRASEDRMQQALRVSRSFTFEWQPSTDRVLRSASCAPILGLAGDAAREDTGRHYFRRIHPDDRARFEQLVGGLTPNAPTYLSEYRVIRDDGSIAELEETGQATFDAAGALQRLVGVTTDITARKQAEAALRASEELNRRTLQALPAHISVIDRDGRIVAVNEAWSVFARDNGAAGLQAVAVGANYLGACRRAASLQDPDAIRALAGIDAVLSGRRQEFTLEYPCHSPGEQRWFLMTVTPLGAGGEGGAVITHLNITERKRAERALQQSEGRLNQAQEIAHLGSWELDLVENRLLWSDEAYRIFGLPPGEFGATYEAFLECVHPDDRQLVDNAYASSLRDGRDTYEVEHRVVRKDTGEIRSIHERCQHFRDASGRIVRSVGMVHDITERKAAEHELRRRQHREGILALTAHRLLATNEPQSVVNSLCRDVMAFLDCDVFFNFLVDEEAGRLRLNACGGIPATEAAKLEWLDYGVAVCGCVARDGCRVTVEDIPHAHDPRTALVAGYGVLAYCCHPLLSQGKVLGTLSFGTRRRAHLSDDDISMMAAVAAQVAVAMQRLRDLTSLRKSEESFRALFDNMHDGFAHCRMLLDDGGRPADFVYLAVNDAFMRLTGLRDVVGKRVTELLPAFREDHPDLMEAYGRVARTGRPERLELQFKPQDIWLTVAAYSPQPGHFAAIFDDITERKQTEARIKASLTEKEVLLKEVHHRVKNNLQVISSLVSLQTTYQADPTVRLLLGDVSDRVRTMALVHEKLYESPDLAQIEFAGYAKSLLDHLWSAHGQMSARVRLITDLKPVVLSVQASVPCGLILNELASNALKHAFRDRPGGDVCVTLCINETDQVNLRVRDNGHGMPAGQDWRQARSLGLRLVHLLAGQLEGGVEVRAPASGGTEFEVSFKRK